MGEEREDEYVLVARKACFDLPTACPDCLPVYIYLRFAKLPFQLRFNLIHPDSDQIPYFESGNYVAFNNEKGGVIESLKVDGIVNLDSGLPTQTVSQWTSAKSMLSSWLADAVMYELWVGDDTSAAYKIYFSDLPWPIGKILHFKKTLQVKKVLGITRNNAERMEAEIYRRATAAYESLSTMLGADKFFVEDRPTSLDAIFLGHALFTLQALPETSILRGKLLQHENLVRYCINLNSEFIEASSSSSSSSLPRSPSGPSSSSAPRKPPSSWRTKAQSKPKREKTEEEKTFKRRGKYFLAAQAISVLIFLSLFQVVEVEGDDDDLGYDD